MGRSNSDREYGGVVWTNHALERMRTRRVSQAAALAVLRNPTRTIPGNTPGTVKFSRTIEGRRIQAVGKIDDKKKWVVLSVWVRGEEDEWGFPEKYVYMLVGWLSVMIKKGLKVVWNRVRGWK